MQTHLEASMAGDVAVTTIVPAGVVCRGGLELLVGGVWVPANGANADGPPIVFFLFDQVVEGATQWRVPEPGAWTFEDAAPLSEPFEGEI
jgi:hypothetical protein